MPLRLMSPSLLLSQVLGEYPAFITVTAFVVDSILAGGAVARSWSSYLAVLVHTANLEETGLHVEAWVHGMPRRLSSAVTRKASVLCLCRLHPAASMRTTYWELAPALGRCPAA